MYIRKDFNILHLLARSWHLFLLAAVLTAIPTVVYLEVLSDKFRVSGIVVGVLGTAIAFFIGFLNSQAYDRWWEARKIWGALVNDSRSFGRMAVSFVFPPTPDLANAAKMLQKRLIYRHISFLYALKARLRDTDSREYLDYLDEEDRRLVSGKKHIPNALLELQGLTIDRAQRDGFLEVWRMTQINQMLNHFSDEMGKSERIKLTVFPVAYSTLVRGCIWLFMVIFPASIADALGYRAIIWGTLLSVLFVMIYRVGQAMVDPFDSAQPGVAMTTITRAIEINLRENLGETDLPAPIEPIPGPKGGDYLP